MLKWFNKENPRAVVAIKNFNLTANSQTYLSTRNNTHETPTKHPRNSYSSLQCFSIDCFFARSVWHLHHCLPLTWYTCLCNFLFVPVYKKQLNIGCLKWDDLFTVTMYYIPVKPCTAAPPMNTTGHTEMWKRCESETHSALQGGFKKMLKINLFYN